MCRVSFVGQYTNVTQTKAIHYHCLKFLRKIIIIMMIDDLCVIYLIIFHNDHVVINIE